MGLALAQLIASHPTQRLVATARNIFKLDGIFPTDNPRSFLVALDVNNADSIKTAFDSAVAKFGRIDVVVNNAGYGLMGDTESFVTNTEDMDKARNIVETNFWGTAQVCAHAVRVFRDENPKSGQIGGVVLNTTSIGGFAGFPGSAFYHASKFAVEGYTESLNKEVRADWNSKFPQYLFAAAQRVQIPPSRRRLITDPNSTLLHHRARWHKDQFRWRQYGVALSSPRLHSTRHSHQAAGRLRQEPRHAGDLGTE